MTHNELEFFASCLAGCEKLLADELKSLNVKRVRPLSGGVAFFGSAACALRVCLWSRVASRVLHVCGRVSAASAADLYEDVRAIPWEDIIAPGASIAVRAHGTNAELRNTQFSALKVKDALCDRLRASLGVRPDVDAKSPDALIEVRVGESRATVSFDLSGVSLHKRSYIGIDAEGDAVLQCGYAASLLALAEWPALSQKGASFLDPEGSESYLTREAAEISADSAPGIARDVWGFFGWCPYDEDAWYTLLDEADARAEAALSSHEKNNATDADSSGDGASPTLRIPQLIACVITEDESLDARGIASTASFIRCAKQAPAGARFAFAGGDGLRERFGVEARTSLTMGRGRVALMAAVYDDAPSAGAVVMVPDSHGGAEHPVDVYDQGSSQFASRLRKVAKERRKWARREGVSCYRIYDADLPEYAVAIDVYEGRGKAEGKTFLHIAEYQAPSSVDVLKAQRRMADVMALAPVVLDVPSERVFSKVREKSKGGVQYRAERRRPYVTFTGESGYLFEVDLNGYLDTGLFLDHRTTRELVGGLAEGKRFLNLFAYTGSATVHAAGGGALETVTVDLSQTYLDWAERNMQMNGFAGDEHVFVRCDVMQWITYARRQRFSFDLIFVDPPTFSNSKAMGERTWDVQRDHVELLIGVSRLLADGGEAIFSCNLRSFKPDWDALARYGVAMEDITAETIPHDFERNPRIHKCFRVKRA